MQAHDPWVMIGYEVKMFNATYKILFNRSVFAQLGSYALPTDPKYSKNQNKDSKLGQPVWNADKAPQLPEEAKIYAEMAIVLDTFPRP
jgi:hypothetical protein